MIQFILLLSMLSSFSFAEEKKDEAKPIRVVVPAWLNDGEYRLTVNREEINTKEKDVEIRPGREQVPVELYDKHGRLVANQSEYYDGELFNLIRERKRRFQFGLGAVFP